MLQFLAFLWAIITRQIQQLKTDIMRLDYLAKLAEAKFGTIAPLFSVPWWSVHSHCLGHVFLISRWGFMVVQQGSMEVQLATFQPLESTIEEQQTMVCSSREFDGRVVDPKNQQPKHAKTMYELRFKKRCGIFECNHYAVYSDAPVAPRLFLEGGGWCRFKVWRLSKIKTCAEHAQTISYNIPKKKLRQEDPQSWSRVHMVTDVEAVGHISVSPTQAITLGINDDGHLDKAAEWRNGGQNSAGLSYGQKKGW